MWCCTWATQYYNYVFWFQWEILWEHMCWAGLVSVFKKVLLDNRFSGWSILESLKNYMDTGAVQCFAFGTWEIPWLFGWLPWLESLWKWEMTKVLRNLRRLFNYMRKCSGFGMLFCVSPAGFCVVWICVCFCNYHYLIVQLFQPCLRACLSLCVVIFPSLFF